MHSLDLSIVAPAFNEEKNVGIFVEAVKKAIQPLTQQFEILIVDDGSSDGTASVIRELNQKDPRVKLIRLSRNFGHQGALTAGLDHATGESVVMMDIDLQHPPALIAEMWAARKNGFEVVHTRRKDDVGLSWFKKQTSALYYALFNRLSDVKIEPNSSDFRLLSRRALDQLNALGEKGRFIRGLTTWIGFRSTTIDFVAQSRLHGQTKYSLKKMIRLAIEGITSFSTRPLKIMAVFGFAVTALSLVYISYAVFTLLSGKTVPGWASILVSVLLMGGIQMMGMGILGIYIGKIFEEVKGRPPYVIAERCG